MKIPLLLLCLLAASLSHLTAQTTISLTFTAEDNGIWLPLDSVRLENLTRGGDTTLYGTDTVLVLDHGIGIHGQTAGHGQQMILFPAYPNPVTHTSTVRLWLPDDGTVTLRLYDLSGRELATFVRSLPAGDHSFTFHPGKESHYLLVAEAADQRQVQKIISLSTSEGSGRLAFNGHLPTASGMRKGKSAFPWVPGDSLRLFGFTNAGVAIINVNPIQSFMYTFLFFSSPAYPPGTVHCNYPDTTVIIDVTNPVTGRIWMDRNLGASQVATSTIDSLAYGDLYQWGRFADGHQCRTSSTTSILSSANMPGHGNFIIAPTNPSDWISPQNVNLWQGVNGANNPCPTGYRLPTEAEFNAERLSWSYSNTTGAFLSQLKLPVAGFRNHGTGSFDTVGSIGSYWTSNVSSTISRRLYFLVDDANISGNNRARANSVRCIRD